MYKLLLASRYLIRRRISYVAVAAVGLSVFIAFVVMTVMNGLVGDFKEKNHAFVGDCVVGTESLVGFPCYGEFQGRLERADFVEAVSTVVTTYAMSCQGREGGEGIKLMGIDPVSYSRVTKWGQSIHIHKDRVEGCFQPAQDPNWRGCCVGIARVARPDSRGRYDRDLVPVGERFEITCFPLTAKGAPARAGAGEVSTQVFHLSDTFLSGLPREDEGLIYIPFDQAQALCGMGGPIPRASAIHIRFRPGTDLDRGTAAVAAEWQDFKRSTALGNLLDAVTVQDWKRYRRAFIGAIEKEEGAMIFMFLLVAFTTVFIVFVVFYMLVLHKTKDIGILKSVGASNAGIIGLYSGFATAVGVFGAGLGLGVGWAFLARINALEQWLFERWGFQLWDRRIYTAIGDIPHHVNAGVAGTILVVAILVCLVGALIPTWMAARLRPTETLQVQSL